MRFHSTRAVILGVALLAYGCSNSSNGLHSATPGEQPVVQPSQQAAASPAETAPKPQTVAAATVSPTAPQAAASRGSASPSGTGTFVGSKVNQHARELASLTSSVDEANRRFAQLRGLTEQNAQRYYAIVAAISARLQIGSTPGNPVLVSQWNSAQSELDRILSDIAALNTLANDVVAQAAMSIYLIDSVGAAYSLSGAVEEDHRQLAKIEDNVNRTVSE